MLDLMTSETPVLSHAKLDAYRCATEFLALAVSILGSLPKGNAELADQLRRASLSISLNIAEGAGRISPPDKRKHDAIARGSALECAAVLDAAEILKIVDPSTVARGNALLARVVAMLTKMSR
jgi:four helix bundle protein